MLQKIDMTIKEEVALLAEGVDRNRRARAARAVAPLSPSSRRAWIEIPLRGQTGHKGHVALLAEGVDRNSPGHTVTLM